jgi:hypothetical protein
MNFPTMNLQTIGRIAFTFAIGRLLAHPPAKLRAQSTFGTVRGITLDQTGAMVPGAQVTLNGSAQESDRAKAGVDI